MTPLIIQRIVCPGCENPRCEWCGKNDCYPDYHCVVHSNVAVHADHCPNGNCHGLVYRCSEIVDVGGYHYLGDLENFISCELCKYRPARENIEYVVDIANNNGNDDGEDDNDDDDDDDDDDGEGRFPYDVDYDEFFRQLAIDRADIANLANNNADDGARILREINLDEAMAKGHW